MKEEFPLPHVSSSWTQNQTDQERNKLIGIGTEDSHRLEITKTMREAYMS